MKRPLLAFILSFLLPGAGLWYLGMWKYGFVNLAIVLSLGFILTFILPDAIIFNYARYIAIGLSSGSGGLAYSIAQQINKKNTDNEKVQTS